MNRQMHARWALLLTLLMTFTGCHPTQPFYLNEDGDLSHYIDSMTEIEYPDVETASLAEAAQAHAPLKLSDPDFDSYWDLTLEEAVSIALQNSKMIRNSAQVRTQIGNDEFTAVSRAGSVYDPALSESAASNQAHVVDQNGNRVLPRAAARVSNQGVEDALSEFDAQVFSFLRYNQTDRPRNVQSGNPFNPTQFQARDTNFLAAISKRTTGGGTYTFRNRTDYSANNIPIGIGRAVPSDYTTTFEAEFQHPLMRNRGTQINRIPVVLARINTDISLAQFEGNVRDLVMEVEQAYWDLYLAFRLLEANKEGRDSAQAFWHEEMAQQATKEGAADEARARSQFYQFRSQVESTLGGSNTIPGGVEGGLYGAEQRLRYLLGLSPTDGRLIRPVDEPTLARVEFDWRDVREEALFRSPELRRQKWVLKQRELELISARNQLLPELNMSVGYRWVGVGDDLVNSDRDGINFPGAGSTAFGELTEGNYQEAFLQMDFTPTTIGARRQRAALRNAELQLAREKAALEEMELLTAHRLSETLRLLDSHYQQAQSLYNRWIAAEDEVRFHSALLKLPEQPGLKDRLLDAQIRRFTARSEFYRTLSEYNKQIAFVHFRKGSLLEYSGVHLAEGPWPQKAYWDAKERARERDASYYLNYGWTRPGVVSRGEVPQGAESLPEGSLLPGEAELVPTPAARPAAADPADADPADGDLFPGGGEFERPMPQEPSESPEDAEPAPVTRRPEGPTLAPPNTRAAVEPGRLPGSSAANPTRRLRPDKKLSTFNWGTLGLSEAGPPEGNPVRQTSHAAEGTKPNEKGSSAGGQPVGTAVGP